MLCHVTIAQVPFKKSLGTSFKISVSGHWETSVTELPLKMKVPVYSYVFMQTDSVA